MRQKYEIEYMRTLAFNHCDGKYLTYFTRRKIYSDSCFQRCQYLSVTVFIVSEPREEQNIILEELFATFLLLLHFNTIPQVVGTHNLKIILAALHNYDVDTVVNTDISV